MVLAPSQSQSPSSDYIPRARNESETHVDSTQMKKHRNDVFRLFPILDPEKAIQLSERIKGDMVQALNMLRDESIAIADMGINTMTQDEVIKELETIYVCAKFQATRCPASRKTRETAGIRYAPQRL